MAVQQAVAERWFKATGTPIIEAYGLSETSPGLTANRCDITEWTGTIGLPFPSTDISIRDDDNKEVPAGERGEICARGPQVMVGYWNRPDETAQVMTPDGFFRTGDIGVMDDQGRVKIVDRKKDMISVSGFKVFPNEVEDIAMMQGGVLECAAVGVPDAHSSEAVKLFVVKKDAGTDRAGLAPLHARQARRLQDAEIHRIPQRPAEDQCRQDPAPRVAGRRMSEANRRAADVVTFWREAGPDRWFKKDAAFDDEIRRRFLRLTKPPPPESSPIGKQPREGALALLILLDQFPRNMFRGQARTFATDPLARAIAAGALVRGFDAQVPADMRSFFYLPFEHSENLADQERGVALLQGGRRRRRPEMGGNSRRHHPPLRPVPAPQRGAWPRHHAGGTGVPRRRRLCRLSRRPLDAAHLLARVAAITNRPASRLMPGRRPMLLLTKALRRLMTLAGFIVLAIAFPPDSTPSK